MSIMQLIVSGLPPLTNPNHFHALFGRYVYGYKPWTHCDNCFVKRQETQINPKMGNGSFHLKDDLFYLCGVGRSLSESVHPELSRKSTNVHLAVMPRKGSVAAVGSVYGATFVIEDAEAIPIRTPIREFPVLRALAEPQRTQHSRCKMFHFAYQMFDVDEISLLERTPVHRLRQEWLSVSGIRKDQSGCMIDPILRWGVNGKKADS
jgi:hypothetical protein